MDVTRYAAYAVIVSILAVAVGVGLYDYRAGLITFGLLTGAAGIWTLTQE